MGQWPKDSWLLGMCEGRHSTSNSGQAACSVQALLPSHLCKFSGFWALSFTCCLHLTHQRPGAATWLTVGRVQERHREGQALLFPWTSCWDHRADEPGQEGVSILHTLNTSAEDSDVWRGSHQVTRQGRQVKNQSRERPQGPGRTNGALTVASGAFIGSLAGLESRQRYCKPNRHIPARPKWEHREQTGQWRLGT